MENALEATNNKKSNKPKNIIKLSEEWIRKLALNSDDKITKTIDNFCIVLENDIMFKNKIFLNELSQKEELLDKNGKLREIETIDIDNMQKYIEKKYGIYDIKKFSSALRSVANEHSYHPIKKYLESMHWDGIKRLDTGFADYLGAENNEYNSMCLRLILFGAIERIYNPGAKFDYMLILKGSQGIGKSTFFKLMCEDYNYYQEDLVDINDNKKIFEYTNGKWFVEMAELVAMKKADVERLKIFILPIYITTYIMYTYIYTLYNIYIF